MIRGLYTAASGMLVENRRQENIAQNLSNVNTVGFKQVYLASISQEEGIVVNMNGENQVGVLPMKVGTDAPYLQLSQGDLRSTEESYDFAIQGDGFFTLQGENGERLYTRDGRFGVDNQGRLVSKEGYPVLMANGNPAIVNQTEFSTYTNGSFNVEGRNYQFMISNFENAQGLVQQGDNLYSYNGNAQVVDGGYEIYQGMVEGSNVNSVDEMVNLIAASRAFQTNSKVLQSLDQVLSLSVNEIGRV